MDSPIVLVRRLLPSSLKELIKSHPNVANVLDALAHMKIRAISPYNDLYAMLSPNEREYLFKLSLGNDPADAIVEIGCYSGGSTYFLGKGAERSSSIVYTIDPFDSDIAQQIAEDDGSNYFGKKKKPSKKEVQKNMGAHGLEEIVKIIEGKSLDIAKEWKYPIGLLFIDGNHNQTFEDYFAWKSRLSPGAVVAIHDSNPNYPLALPTVKSAVERIRKLESFKRVEFVDSITAFFT